MDVSHAWPPSLVQLQALVIAVLQKCTGCEPVLSPSAVVETASCGSSMELRMFGLNSTQAAKFTAALEEQLGLAWPDMERWIPILPGSLIFRFNTVGRLADFLHSALLEAAEKADSKEINVMPLGNRTEPAQVHIDHVVSLGTLCMSIQIMETCGWRRWPGPFDWTFSIPDLVTHCLQDNFETFLRQSEYVPAESGKAGHKTYSSMLNRNVIFNHHNPLISYDYDFLCSCVSDFRTLFWDWPRDHCSHDSLAPDRNARVLFLLFSLERRSALDDKSILKMFEQLCRQCRVGVELVTVKVVTNCENGPHKSMLLQCHSELDPVVGKQVGRLSVFELHCRGGHDGWRFGDQGDLDMMTRILDETLVDYHFSLDTYVMDSSDDVVQSKTGTQVTTWAQKRFGVQHRRSALRDADPINLVLHADAVRKLLKHLGRPANEDSNFDPQLAETSWCELGERLRNHPVHVALDGLCRVWCLGQSPGIDEAFRVVAGWEPYSRQQWPLLLLPKSELLGLISRMSGRDDSMDTFPLEEKFSECCPKLSIIYCFKKGSELFRVKQPLTNVLTKLPRTSENYFVIGQIAARYMP